MDQEISSTGIEMVMPSPAHKIAAKNGAYFRLAISAIVPLALWSVPLGIDPKIQTTLAISCFMILAWITNAMEYAVSGLIGCVLYWASGVVLPATAFAGFAETTTWFVFAATLIGLISTKSGLPQRIGSFIVTKIGVSYSRILIGLIITDFLLTFLVPNGTSRLVIMATMAIGLIKLFGVSAKSNVARGIFLMICYTATIFDKMIIAGAAAITARGIIINIGNVEVTWTKWFIAFLPAAVITIIGCWALTLWLFPPEVVSLQNKEDELRRQFSLDTRWTPLSIKAAILLIASVLIWMTDFLHHIDPGIVGLTVSLIALLPVVGVLSIDDLKSINFLPVIFVGAALSMSKVLVTTGALALLTHNAFFIIGPLLSNQALAVPLLYWSAFLYHFVLGSEISMLASSLPVLLHLAKTHGLNPLWAGMLWTFASGGKLFVYQSSVLVLGYSYGYFRHSDLIKLGAGVTILEFIAVILTTAYWWPIIGILPR